MKPRVYLETSVISYWTAPPSRDTRVAAFQQATHEWFSAKHTAFDLFVSDLVVEEASAGDAGYAQARLTAMQPFPRLLIAPEARQLAPFVLKSANLPAGALADALHISVAALNGMDYVLTWNMRHIANEDIRQRGYPAALAQRARKAEHCVSEARHTAGIFGGLKCSMTRSLKKCARLAPRSQRVTATISTQCAMRWRAARTAQRPT